MNAIRTFEVPDVTHSLYVDQWDWEKVLLPEERTAQYLYHTVRQIYAVLLNKRHIGAEQSCPALVVFFTLP